MVECRTAQSNIGGIPDSGSRALLQSLQADAWRCSSAAGPPQTLWIWIPRTSCCPRRLLQERNAHHAYSNNGCRHCVGNLGNTGRSATLAMGRTRHDEHSATRNDANGILAQRALAKRGSGVPRSRGPARIQPGTPFLPRRQPKGPGRALLTAWPVQLPRKHTAYGRRSLPAVRPDRRAKSEWERLVTLPGRRSLRRIRRPLRLPQRSSESGAKLAQARYSGAALSNSSSAARSMGGNIRESGVEPRLCQPSGWFNPGAGRNGLVASSGLFASPGRKGKQAGRRIATVGLQQHGANIEGPGSYLIEARGLCRVQFDEF
jgi:hypothetical protein